MCVCVCVCVCVRVRVRVCVYLRACADVCVYTWLRPRSRHKDPRTTAIGLMSAAQCVGCLPARIATSTKPGLLRVRCPAHLVDTIGVRNPAAPSSNSARKPRLTLSHHCGARRNLSRRLLLSALRKMRCIWPAPNPQHNGFVPPLVANLALHPCNASAQPNNAKGTWLRTAMP